MPPEFREVYNLWKISEILSLWEDDIDYFYPIQSVSTGLSFVLVPYKKSFCARKFENILLKLTDFLNGNKETRYLFETRISVG
ncbi:MAG: hypothetical protein DRP92_07565 [Candidatus Neomarinimicrobiota bacterium]|nr:MAG: hypothetical protein DRP92_07565 [Candidatus Neomarinimicrobiota bacterium]